MVAFCLIGGRNNSIGRRDNSGEVRFCHGPVKFSPLRKNFKKKDSISGRSPTTLTMFGSVFGAAMRTTIVKSPASKALMQVRTKMKSHNAADKRFIKTGTGIKRKQAGRNHGNGRFSASSLSHLDTFVKVGNAGGHLKKLARYMS